MTFLKSYVLTVVSLLGLVSMQAFAQTAELKEKVDTEVVVLTRHGLEPAVIDRPPGKFRLLLINSLGLPGVTFVMEDGKKSSLKEKSLDRNASRRWVEEYTLPSGTYTLRVQELPSISLKLIIR